MPTDGRRGILLPLLIFAALAALYVACLGDHALMEPDEGRYAEIPREMLESGDFITPRLNYVKYYEKPPMTYWITAASMAIFGEDELAVRLPMAICAILTAAFAAWVGAMMFSPEAGLLAGIVTATSLLHFAIGRIALTDMPLSLALTAALAFYWAAMRAPTRGESRAMTVGFFASMAIGVLCKGLVAIVLPCGIIFWQAIFTRRIGVMKHLFSPVGIAVFLLLSVPYFYVICTIDPTFFDFFFIREHLLRFTTTIHARYEPWWFFLPLLPAAVMPWTGWLAQLFSRHGAARDRAHRAETIYLLLWCGVILLFFSISKSKLIPYIVPCVPPLAILIGAELSRMIERGRSAGPGLALTSALNLILAAALVGYALFGSRVETARVLPSALMAAACLGAGSVASLLAARHGRVGIAVGASCICAALFLGSFAGLWRFLGDTRSLKQVSETLNMEAPGFTPVAWNEVLQGLSFYTGRRVMNVGGTGELEFGYERELLENGGDWNPSEERFAELWTTAGPFALVLDQGSDVVGRFEAARTIEVGRYVILLSRETN